MKSYKKLIVRLIALCTLTVIMAVGCGKKQTDSSVEDVKGRGVLRVAILNYDTSLMYFDSEANAYRGLEAEVIDVIASALGVEVEYVPTAKDQMFNAVNVGNADIAIGYIDENNTNISTVAKTMSYGGEDLYIVSPRGVYASNLNVFDKKVVGVSTLIDANAYGNLYTSGVEDVLKYNGTQSVIADLKSNKIAGYICYRSEGSAIAESGEFQIQSCKELEREAFVIISSKSSGNLIVGCNNHIEAYLTGEELPTWVKAQLEEENKKKVDDNSLYKN